MAEQDHSPDEPQTLSEYLSYLKARSGMSLDHIAREAGYKGRSSVQRYFEDTSIEVLSLPIAKKLAKAFYNKGTPPIKIASLVRLIFRDISEISMDLKSVANILEIDHDEEFGQVTELGTAGILHVDAIAEAARWHEGDAFPDEEDRLIMLAFGGPDSYENEYAILIKDNSVSNVISAGSYAICKQYKSIKSTYPNGKYVHIIRQKADLIEHTIRRISWDEFGMHLSFDSADKAFREVIVMIGEMRA